MTQNSDLTDKDDRNRSTDLSCESCILERDWDNRFCHGMYHGEYMCRYGPEILLIEAQLLKPIDVKIGEWDPEYSLSDGTKIKLSNEKRVASCHEEVEKRLREKNRRR